MFAVDVVVVVVAPGGILGYGELEKSHVLPICFVVVAAAVLHDSCVVPWFDCTALGNAPW